METLSCLICICFILLLCPDCWRKLPTFENLSLKKPKRPQHAARKVDACFGPRKAEQQRPAACTELWFCNQCPVLRLITGILHESGKPPAKFLPWRFVIQHWPRLRHLLHSSKVQKLALLAPVPPVLIHLNSRCRVNEPKEENKEPPWNYGTSIIQNSAPKCCATCTGKFSLTSKSTKYCIPPVLQYCWWIPSWLNLAAGREPLWPWQNRLTLECWTLGNFAAG